MTALRRRRDGLKPSPNAINRHGGGKGKGMGFPNPLDWCIEDYWCTELLLDATGWRGTVLDPACGSGRILQVCRARGLEATGSDLVDRGAGALTPVDFTQPGAWPDGSFDYVISNPPYYSGKGPVVFGDAALRVARKGVALLVALPFLASEGRYAVFTGRWPVSLVLVLSSRSSMPPGELLLSGAVKPEGGKEDYCWIILTPGHTGRAEIGWTIATDKRRP